MKHLHLDTVKKRLPSSSRKSSQERLCMHMIESPRNSSGVYWSILITWAPLHTCVLLACPFCVLFSLCLVSAEFTYTSIQIKDNHPHRFKIDSNATLPTTGAFNLLMRVLTLLWKQELYQEIGGELFIDSGYHEFLQYNHCVCVDVSHWHEDTKILLFFCYSFFVFSKSRKRQSVWWSVDLVDQATHGFTVLGHSTYRAFKSILPSRFKERVRCKQIHTLKPSFSVAWEEGSTCILLSIWKKGRMKEGPHNPAILYSKGGGIVFKKITIIKPSEPLEVLVSAIETVTKPSEASGGSMIAI